MKEVFYKDKTFHVHPQVYEPREDSFLLADVVPDYARGDVLDLGTGCGIQAIIAAEKASKVVATDINPHAIECARENAKLNNVELDLRQGDLFEPVAGEKFDLIIFNLPYVPVEEKPEEWIDHSYVEGEVIKRFLEGYRNFLKPGGCCLVLVSTVTKTKIKGEVVARKKVAFEELFVAKLSESDNAPNDTDSHGNDAGEHDRE